MLQAVGVRAPVITSSCRFCHAFFQLEHLMADHRNVSHTRWNGEDIFLSLVSTKVPPEKQQLAPKSPTRAWSCESRRGARSAAASICALQQRRLAQSCAWHRKRVSQAMPPCR